MAEDPTIRWTLASPWGILRNETADAWNSGHATDVLELENGALILATATGGVWLVDPASGNLSLSDDWQVPNTNCLAFGPDDPRHIFVGCAKGIIRETNLDEVSPVLNWREVTDPLPKTAGIVHSIAIIRNRRFIIAACEGGLFWAVIPATGQSPRPPYRWKKAIANEGQGFWDVAVGATRESEARQNLEDLRTITIVAGGKFSGGVFVGQFEGGELVMKRAAILRDDGSTDDGLFNIVGTTSVSSCEQFPNVLYAACAWPDGRLFRVLHSKDGGRTWVVCQTNVTNIGDELTNLAGDLGAQWTNTISAHPTDPGLAMVGWVGRYLTLDSGRTWRQIDDVHLHADQAAIQFYPPSAAPSHYGYICSDGGVTRINLDDFLNPPGVPFQSNYNRQLPTLQFYSTLMDQRNFYGTLAVSRTIPGLVSAGSQDNGNLCCRLFPTPTPWVDLSGCDGGWNAFIADGALLHANVCGPGGPVRATTFDAAGAVTSTTVVPITVPPDPSGLKGPFGEAVVQPVYRNESGKRLEAIGSLLNQVFGLFVDENESPRYSWELIASIPAGEQVSAVGSFHGGSIFAGTMTGKMYNIDARRGTVLEMPVVVPKPSPGAVMTMAAITRIVFFNENEAFAILNGVNATVEVIDPVTGGRVKKTTTSIYVIKLDGLKWVITQGFGLSNQPLYALEAIGLRNSGLERALIAATDEHVYVSRDDGANWQPAALGLPRTPHCADLRFMSIENEAWIYLSTYGRSLWVAKLR